MFPLNYFQAAFSPKQIFIQRNHYKYWQLLFAFLVINGLMLMPMSLKLSQITQAPLENYMPKAIAALNPSLIKQLNKLPVDNNQLNINQEADFSRDKQSVAALVTDKRQAEKKLQGKTGLVFYPQGFLIKEGNEAIFDQAYLDAGKISQASTVQDLQREVSSQWFQLNKPAVLLTQMLNVSFLMAVSNLIFILGTALFLRLMKFYRKFDIHNFKEALTMSLLCLGLPTLLTMILGFLWLNPLEMISLQGFAFIGWLMLSFWLTHFNDEYIKRGV